MNTKWANFKYKHVSHIDIASPDTGNANIHADWEREAKSDDAFINGIPLKKIAPMFNHFKKEEDVIRFFNQVILKDFSGDKQQKEAAVNYLKTTFHQGGLQRPVFSALATSIKDKTGKHLGILNDKELEKKINIQTNASGFKVQEYCSVGSLFVFGPPLEQFAEKKQDESGNPVPPQLISQSSKEKLIQATGTIAIDFSKNASSPSLTVENNQITISHSELKKHMDQRTMGERIVDYFKNVLGLDKVADISPKQPDPDILNNEKQDLSTSEPSDPSPKP